MKKGTSTAVFALTLIGTTIAAMAGAAGATTHGTSALTATVVYKSQPLGSIWPARTAQAGERRDAGAPARGRTARVSLLDNGTQPAGVALPGSGPVSATLVLQTPRVRVTGPGGGATERSRSARALR